MSVGWQCERQVLRDLRIFQKNDKRLRRALSAAVAIMAIMTAMHSSMGGVNPGLLLDIMSRSDGLPNSVAPYAFYITCSVVVPVNQAASYMAAARLAVSGVEALAVHVSQSESDSAACVAVTVVMGLDVSEARGIIRCVRSALGMRSRLAACVSGYTEWANRAQKGEWADELTRIMSEPALGVTCAVRDTGEVYVGMPFIPMSY